MDPVTHILSGALLVRTVQPAGPDRRQRQQILVGGVAAAFPDIDIVLRLVDTLTYLNWHQGLTHSLLMLPGWAWLLAHLCARWLGQCAAWRNFFIPACLGLLIHILGDLVTAYGLMLFAPISSSRFAWPLVFVMDPWLTGLIVLGLVTSLYRPAKRACAMLAWLGVGGYLACSGWLQAEAVRAAEAYAVQQRLTQHTVSVLPQPLSPFNRMLIVAEDDRLHVALIHLRRDAPAESVDGGNWLRQMAAAYRPLTMADWQVYGLYTAPSPAEAALARLAWQQPAMAPFRGFAKFPVLDGIDYTGPGTCIWFIDLRFKLPGLPPSFRYGACREDERSSWYLQRQRGAFWID